MSEVYIVTAGNYSAYHIVAVFYNMEAAQALASVTPDARGVEEYQVNPVDPFPLVGLTLPHVAMERDGTVVGTYPEEFSNAREPELFPAWTITEPERQRLAGSVWARDEQHAVKTMNEKRAQLIASGEWK